MAKIRTRARAVDMLGRQQIATIQNAIAELFKNAFDAYASKVQVDYLKGVGPDVNGMLLVRDDGFGMTREDFEDKWLVLGTESKVQESGTNPGYVPKGMTPRKITGEKGIGRLAIALLGRQVVVFTRARRDDELHDLVVSWIHWGLFEIPGVNLDAVEFPVETFPGGQLPTVEQMFKLREQLVADVRKSSYYAANKQRCDKILSEIVAFSPDIAGLDGFLQKSDDGKGMSLVGDSTGTSFLIGSVNRVLPKELAEEDEGDGYSFRALLLGFVDPVFSQSAPQFSTSFKVWDKGSFSGTEYLDNATFFTRDELDNSTDHFFSGEVDEFGQCTATLRIYDKTLENVKIPWRNDKGQKTECGPFEVVFGTLQGKRSESIVGARDEKRFSNMYAKLAEIGGVYMYRDGIRILPYGGSNDTDWLEIEKRRNLGANYYFFSYRRMVGAVLLTSENNPSLREKAGREGLQKNVPYQQTRSIIKNILIQLAAEYFRKNSDKGDFNARRDELERESAAYEKKMKQSRMKRERFAKELDRLIDACDGDIAANKTQELLRALDEKMRVAAQLPDSDQAAVRLVAVEKDSLEALAAIRESFVVRRPLGVGLSKRLQGDWQVYQGLFASLERDVFKPCADEIARRIGEVAKQARLYIDQRKRLDQQLKLLAEQRKKQLRESNKAAKDNASEAQKAVLAITEKAKQALDDVIAGIEAEMNRTPIQDLSDEEVEKLREKWESQLTEIEEKHRLGVDAAKEMLSSLTVSLTESGGENAADAALAASKLESRVLDLEEQADQDFEMVQLGLAVSIINHEFISAIGEVRKGLRDLEAISKRAPAVRDTYERIRDNFTHLDGHLKLFTPLQRRVQRQKLRLTGLQLESYARNVFAARLLRHDVKMMMSESFKRFTVECFPSTIYPVIINLVDNAFFWLGAVQGERKIVLDATADMIVVANNGPKVDVRDVERIFERGFTRKPGGRGLGLYISNKALQQEGMHLELTDPPEGCQTAFGIVVPRGQGGSHV